MTTGHYLRSMKQLTNQWTPQNFRDQRRQRLYLKDLDCPLEWRDALRKIIHPNLFYLNENVTSTGSSDGSLEGTGVLSSSDSALAPAGDLMSSLPKEMRAENMMCYIGHEGTFTPAHREMCASVGHNIMVETSGSQSGEQPGRSIWFMTESKDREVVREYFLSMLGHEIEIEKHFAQINAWKKAPFEVYMVEQRAGDFIIIPPLAPHQVWNRGTRTMKVAWNRTTAETLGFALHEALPKARLVCRDEQYKNKAIIFHTLERYSQTLLDLERQQKITETTFLGLGQDIVRNSPRARQLTSDFKTLFNLITEVLVDESFAHREKRVEFLPFDSCVTCSYCRSNIFNRFLTCKNCTRTLMDGSEDAYDVCMECYAMGRSCACLSGLQWCEQWEWSALMAKYESWREIIFVNDGYIDLEASPLPFEVARLKAGKKSVAQICQEALLKRPWRDITKPDFEDIPTDSEEDHQATGSPKKTRRKKKKGDLRRCHVCCHKDYSYRVHQCTNSGCSEGYCYGVLYRAFDMMPQVVQQQENWQCPKCLGICNCGHCRRSGNANGYAPKNTSLGHDTRPIADDRSVEALVDFRVHNLSWLKAAGEESRSKDSKRMQRLREQANDAKALFSTEDPEKDTHGRQNLNASFQVVNGHRLGSAPVGQGSNSSDNFLPINSTGVATSDSLPNNRDTAEYENAEIDDYPDLSIFTGHGIGMGYYERADAPDRILFDPYKAPTGTVRLDEPEVPESMKKSIRAARRKVKKENDDPDFTIPRSHHKRRRLTDNNDVHETLDPALFMSALPPAILAHTEQQSNDVDGVGSEKGFNVNQWPRLGCGESRCGR